jgi:hypothetical protein
LLLLIFVVATYLQEPTLGSFDLQHILADIDLGSGNIPHQCQQQDGQLLDARQQQQQQMQMQMQQQLQMHQQILAQQLQQQEGQQQQAQLQPFGQRLVAGATYRTGPQADAAPTASGAGSTADAAAPAAAAQPEGQGGALKLIPPASWHNTNNADLEKMCRVFNCVAKVLQELRCEPSQDMLNDQAKQQQLLKGMRRNRRGQLARSSLNECYEARPGSHSSSSSSSSSEMQRGGDGLGGQLQEEQHQQQQQQPYELPQQTGQLQQQQQQDGWFSSPRILFNVVSGSGRRSSAAGSTGDVPAAAAPAAAGSSPAAAAADNTSDAAAPAEPSVAIAAGAAGQQASSTEAAAAAAARQAKRGSYDMLEKRVRGVMLDKVGALLKRRSALFGLWTHSKLIILADQAEAGPEGRCQIVACYCW